MLITAETEADPEREGVTDNDGVCVEVREIRGEFDGVDEIEELRDVIAERDSETVAGGEIDERALTDGETDTRGEAESETLTLGLRETVTVTDTRAVAVDVAVPSLSVADLVPAGDAVPDDRRKDPVGDTVFERSGDIELVIAAVADSAELTDRVAATEPDTEADEDAMFVGDSVTDAVGETDDANETPADADEDDVAELDLDELAEAETELVADGSTVDDSVAIEERLSLEDPDDRAVAEEKPDRVPAVDIVFDVRGDRDDDDEPEELVVTEDEADSLCVVSAERVGEGEGVDERELDTDAVVLGDTVPVLDRMGELVEV